jgi:mono/diheme cytochrome c family protein
MTATPAAKELPVPANRFLRPLCAVLLAAPFVFAVACGGGAAESTATPEQVAAGEKVFMTTCATCHGRDAMGLPRLGKGLHYNKFVKSNDDAALVAFIQVGRRANDPLNTTGVDMPPRGGNPALTDQDLANVVAYVRTLQ